jgi:drug/metabolite transporter (DMT)-like permease
MDEHNPYAPSRASLQGAAASPADGNGGIWRDGNVLVLLPDATLPHRCVKCNEPAEPPTRERKVYWHNPWIYVLVLLNLLIYAVVALIVRKKAVIAPGLCPTHKARRRTGIAVGWVLFLGGLALVFIGFGQGSANSGFSGLVLLLASALTAVYATRILRPVRIDSSYVRLKGCGSGFLDSMPPFAG